MSAADPAHHRLAVSAGHCNGAGVTVTGSLPEDYFFTIRARSDTAILVETLLKACS